MISTFERPSAVVVHNRAVVHHGAVVDDDGAGTLEGRDHAAS